VPQTAPDTATSVHPLETSLPLTPRLPPIADLPPGNPACRWRHSGWADHRNRVYHALQRTGQTDRRLGAFAACGSAVFVQQHKDDPALFRLAGSGCHDRFCLPCAQRRAFAIQTRLLARLGRQPARFLTLTLRTGTEPLADSLDKLYRCFSQLRRLPLWRKCVTGGVAFLELKWIPETERWHPHLHCLIQGSFLPQASLKADWLRVTRDSSIVDIRLVRSQNDAAHYVSKYASKPFNTSFLFDPPRLDEAVVALAARRLALTFGSWRGYRLTPNPDESDWTTIGLLSDVCDRADAGDTEAMRALHAINQDLLHAITGPRSPPPTVHHRPRLSSAVQATMAFNARPLR
jgi:hypothetical protein